MQHAKSLNYHLVNLIFNFHGIVNANFKFHKQATLILISFGKLKVASKYYSPCLSFVPSAYLVLAVHS